MINSKDKERAIAAEELKFIALTLLDWAIIENKLYFKKKITKLTRIIKRKLRKIK